MSTHPATSLPQSNEMPLINKHPPGASGTGQFDAPESRRAFDRRGGAADECSEASFLEQRKQETREAMQCSLDQLRASLGTAADVGLWTQKYPWVGVGAAAAAGFVAAKAVGAIMKSPSRATSPSEYAAPLPARASSDQGSFLGTILRNLAQAAVHGFIITAAQTAMQGVSTGDEPADDATACDTAAHG